MSSSVALSILVVTIGAYFLGAHIDKVNKK